MNCFCKWRLFLPLVIVVLVVFYFLIWVLSLASALTSILFLCIYFYVVCPIYVIHNLLPLVLNANFQVFVQRVERNKGWCTRGPLIMIWMYFVCRHSRCKYFFLLQPSRIIFPSPFPLSTPIIVLYIPTTANLQCIASNCFCTMAYQCVYLGFRKSETVYK